MKTYSSLFILFFTLLLVIAGCSNNKKVAQVSDEKVVVYDSIHLLTITKVDDYRQERFIFYYMDTVNYKLSEVQTYFQENIYYQCYFLENDSVITCKNRFNPKISFLIENGLIREVKFDDEDEGIIYQYDSLQHLSKVIYGNGMDSLIWSNDTLKKVYNIMTGVSSYAWTTKEVKFAKNNSKAHYSPELFAEMVTIPERQFLFFCMGLFGKLPIGSDYSIEKQEGDYPRLSNITIYSNKYTNSGMLKESSTQKKGSERIDRQYYNWNFHNFDRATRLIKKTR